MKQTAKRRRLHKVARELAGYLAEHPDAADSLEGILRWWLPRLRLQEATKRIEDALDELIKEGIVERHTLPDRTIKT